MGAQFSDYEFGFRHGERYSMDRTSYKEANFNIATDTGSLTVDIEGKRVELTDVITGYSEMEIRALTIPSNKLYLARDTFNLLVFDIENGVWRRCNSEIISHAQKADNDSEGNNIFATYETKENAESTREDLQRSITTLQDEVSSINRFNVIFINPGESLPDIGETFVIYFVPNVSVNEDGIPETSNTYVEYIWTGDRYEQIGLISADLSEYYKKTDTMSYQEINSALSTMNTDIQSTYLTKTKGVTDVKIDSGQLSITINGATTSKDIELDFGDEDA